MALRIACRAYAQLRICLFEVGDKLVRIGEVDCPTTWHAVAAQSEDVFHAAGAKLCKIGIHVCPRGAKTRKVRKGVCAGVVLNLRGDAGGVSGVSRAARGKRHADPVGLLTRHAARDGHGLLHGQVSPRREDLKRKRLLASHDLGNAHDWHLSPAVPFKKEIIVPLYERVGRELHAITHL